MLQYVTAETLTTFREVHAAGIYIMERPSGREVSLA